MNSFHRQQPLEERPAESDSTDLPWLRSWRAVYVIVTVIVCLYFAGLAILPPRLQVNALDYLVLLVTLVGIAGYGMWRTRGRSDLQTYLKGKGDTSWLTIGLSVMATQASAITFLSVPGQGYQDGLGFVQVYFGGAIRADDHLGRFFCRSIVV